VIVRVGDQELANIKEICAEETYFAAEIKRVFRAADRNNDGILTYDELIRVMRAMGFVKSRHEMDRIWAAVDGDGSGYVDYDEFVEWVVHDPRSSEIKQAEWIHSIHAPSAEKPGEYVPLYIYDAAFEMHGPGVVVLGKNATEVPEVEDEDEWYLLGVSNNCIDCERSPVVGVSFDIHGHDFQIGFVTAQHRWSRRPPLDAGVSFVQVQTPYETINEIRIVDEGISREKCFGHFKEAGRSTVHLEITSQGNVNFRHNDKHLYTTSRPLNLPVFVKVFTASDGPLLQDLKWIGPPAKCKSEPCSPTHRSSTGAPIFGR
jgi:hypothetical protein